MSPTVGVGRMVHVVLGGQCIAGIVTKDEGGPLQLHVYPPELKDGAMFSVGYDEDKAEGSWHWPERI